MTEETKRLRDRAEEGRMLYRSGNATMEEAKELVMPYINHFNNYSKKLAKKYNQRPKFISFNSFCR